MTPEQARALAQQLELACGSLRRFAVMVEAGEAQRAELQAAIDALAPQTAELADSVEKLRAEKTALETEIRLLTAARAKAAVEEEAARRSLDGALVQLQQDAASEMARIAADKKARASEHIQAMAALENALSTKRLELRALEEQVAAKRAD